MMSIPYKKQGFCGDKNFGFYWNEIERSENNHWIFGEFGIFVNNTQILQQNTQDIVYTLNCILWELKQTIPYIKKGITLSDDTKENLYFMACRYRKYWTYIEDEQYVFVKNSIDVDETKIDKVLEKIENDLNEYEKNYSSGGVEFDLYTEISDQGWQFFLFQNQDKTKDRLIYSNDWGKTVHEVQLELGTIERVLSELPDL